MSDWHRPVRIGNHGFAGIWRDLLPEAAALHPPDERFAPCNACPQVEAGAFLAAVKCCGYLPQVPNVQLGLALQDVTTAPLVRRVIAAGHALPYGTEKAPARFARKAALDAAGQYGTDPSMACPFLQDAGCGIYAYRNAVCSTYFCNHEHGDDGEQFWSDLQALLGAVEVGLSRWAMEAAGMSWAGFAERLNGLGPRLGQLSTPDEAWAPAALDVLWGEWRGREEAFFIACAEAAQAGAPELWAASSAQDTTDPMPWWDAVRAWLPEAHRGEVPELDDGTINRVTNDDLWTHVVGISAELRYVPWGDEVVLDEDVWFETPNRRLPLLFGSRHKVHGGRWVFWATDAERKLLEHFRDGAALDAALLESQLWLSVENPDSFVSQCLRREILLEYGDDEDEEAEPAAP